MLLVRNLFSYVKYCCSVGIFSFSLWCRVVRFLGVVFWFRIEVVMFLGRILVLVKISIEISYSVSSLRVVCFVIRVNIMCWIRFFWLCVCLLGWILYGVLCCVGWWILCLDNCWILGLLCCCFYGLVFDIFNRFCVVFFCLVVFVFCVVGCWNVGWFIVCCYRMRWICKWWLVFDLLLGDCFNRICRMEFVFRYLINSYLLVCVWLIYWCLCLKLLCEILLSYWLCWKMLFLRLRVLLLLGLVLFVLCGILFCLGYSCVVVVLSWRSGWFVVLDGCC